MSEVDADVQGSGASEVGLSLRAAVSVFVGVTPLLYSPLASLASGGFGGPEVAAALRQLKTGNFNSASRPKRCHIFDPQPCEENSPFGRKNVSSLEWERRQC